MTALTAHFDLDEFACRSRGRLIYPPEEWVGRIAELARILEAVRGVTGRPVRILSGYRTREHNAAVGGARRSQHCLCRAADFRDWRGDNWVTIAAYDYLERNAAALGVGGLGRYDANRRQPRARVHVDIRPVRPGARPKKWRRQA